MRIGSGNLRGALENTSVLAIVCTDIGPFVHPSVWFTGARDHHVLSKGLVRDRLCVTICLGAPGISGKEFATIRFYRHC